MIPVNTKINETEINEKYETSMSKVETQYGVLNLPESRGLSNRERGFLDLAIRMSETSMVDNKHGAVVVKNGSVHALGVNKWRNPDIRWNSEEEYLPVRTVHAEIDALSRVNDANGAVLYIARVGLQGEERMSRPCRRCMVELRKRGVKRVIYTVG